MCADADFGMPLDVPGGAANRNAKLFTHGFKSTNPFLFALQKRTQQLGIVHWCQRTAIIRWLKGIEDGACAPAPLPIGVFASRSPLPLLATASTRIAGATASNADRLPLISKRGWKPRRLRLNS